MSEPSTLSRRSRSSGDSQMTYSLGTYVRETETVLCSSISRASLRASSTGRTSERKTRPKVPSTRSASLLSRLRRTLIVAPALPGQNGLARREDAATAATRMLRARFRPPRTQREGEHGRDDCAGDRAARGGGCDGGLDAGAQPGRPCRGADRIGDEPAASDQPGQHDGGDGEDGGQGGQTHV